ncbi:PREDICTED: uncharacterized protein LOC104607648 [Nelumbo nucifera]|uniref:Phthiocerol/phthiodiolone dimycocerosyl transferase C-terminal domain-containing protein n=2 Tax=Nelumbo nucifera TaxID=4432 RepID=A0A822Y9T7_NELNU|nr:PREDICTED: uncharacterized protein LOC104607648 [Nelumbo nucifera]DAD28863.1 TPA_asm: hypothetical protein HUJ06_030331 [Nelumbo nucifera]
MAGQNFNDTDNSQQPGSEGRSVGGTEYSWCRAVPGGTGITVLSLLLSKLPDISALQNALHKLQNSHPIFRSKLTHDPTTNTFSFAISPIPSLQIESFDVPFTSHLLQNNPLISPFHCVLEHELKRNPWSPKHEPPIHPDTETVFASLYSLSDTKWVLALRFHTAVCDRTSAEFVLREMVRLVGDEKGIKTGKKGEVGLGIEELIPSGKANKPFWARGIDLLGYSLNSFRFANLEFLDTISPRSSEVVRLQMNSDDTTRLITACKERGIKLSGALAAAGLIAAHSSKDLLNHHPEKYAVVTLIDCRSLLDPVLHSCHLGFYHSAILNTHDIKGGEDLWELAKRCYMSLSNSMDCNKHFSDMGDLNYLMCKAIDNPGFTPSSSLRTCFISVFENPLIDDLNDLCQEVGLEDYMGCSSVHSVGPSIAIFDTIRNGQLDCACVYPSPLHSREQMQKLIDNMKRILVS